MEAFCQGLKLLVERENLRREMGERGREFVQQTHSRERLVANVLALYEDLAGQGSICAAKSSHDVHAG